MYYWLRTYLLERRDVANKSEYGRMALAQQRMQQNVSGAGTSASIGLVDGNARVAGQGGGQLASDNQLHQVTQSGGGVGSHDGSNTQVQEPERSAAVEGNMPGTDQSLHQSSSSNDGGQNVLRRNGAMGLVASAASAFDAAKDIMETLRSKHTNLASELEVFTLTFPVRHSFFSIIFVLSIFSFLKNMQVSLVLFLLVEIAIKYTRLSIS